MFDKIRNKVALTISYLLLQFIATVEVRNRLDKALKSGLREQGVVDLWGTPARRRTMVFSSIREFDEATR